jgi:FkbH-like protein
MENLTLRAEIDALIASGKEREAASCLANLWHLEGGPATAGFVVSRFEGLKEHLGLARYRVAILRSFTTEPVVPLLRAGAYTAGIDLCVHVGDFNAYVQEIFDEGSSLYRFTPDAVVLAVQTCDIAPELWRDYADLKPEEIHGSIARVADCFREWIKAFRARSQAHLIVHNLEQKAVPSRGVLDSQSEDGQAAAIAGINAELHRIVREYPATYLLDYDAVVARYGRLSWRDERKWASVRMPFAADHLIHVADEWLCFLRPLTGRIAKALVTDLDNTLWGGVIGEDGISGIKLGMDHPGAAFQAVQRAILDLYRRGILLAICSKNNLDDALEVLRQHPEMRLRPEHFAAMRINWNDKSQNLREIAEELNIGIDSLVFLDDNPVERQRIRSELPEVSVVELPNDCTQFERTLRRCAAFERLDLSEEDYRRNAYYAGQRERAELERRSGASKEEFYRSLRQQVEIAGVEPRTATRIAQLTQKTNQFNLTTKRYTEQQIAEMESCHGWQVNAARVVDCFGDNGLVGVAITRQVDTSCEIDTFVLSCRVIGRTVETALLSHIVDQARTRGARYVRGWFLPTKKNAPAKDFYENHGFHLASQNGKGSYWELDLAQTGVSCPTWIQLTGERCGTK